MKSISYSILVILLMQAGCKKVCEHSLLPVSIKPFLFKEGSRWVFSNPISGVNDTFLIVKSTSEIKRGATPYQCSGEATVEVFDMTVVNRLDTFRVSASGRPHLHFWKTPLTMQANIFDASLTVGQCSNTDNSLCLTNVVSLTVGSNVFSEAYEITTTLVDGNGNDLSICDMYWVKNVGIVRVVLHNSGSSTFNLLSRNIVQ